MKPYQLVLLAPLLTLLSCSVNTTPANSNKQDTLVQQDTDMSQQKGLAVVMQMKDTIKIGDPVEMKFTVWNNADTAQQFCKWHTPFEPLLSKYLDIKDENGVEADYRGAMAKRVMPPPASSYIMVDPKDSLSSTVDLLKAYSITKPSRYTIHYSGQNMSGLAVSDSISFVYTEK